MGFLCLFFYNTDYIQGIVSSLGVSNPVVFVAAFVGVQGLIEAFLQMPLRGYAYVARKKALRIPPNMAVTGRALVVAPYGAVLNDGVQLTGPMVIFSFSDIVVGQGAVLKKVLLFTPKRLIVGDYSQIDGIMAAGRSVTLGEGTRYRRDESLLTPYRTPYIF